jgi:hypothetical protein
MAINLCQLLNHSENGSRKNPLAWQRPMHRTFRPGVDFITPQNEVVTPFACEQIMFKVMKALEMTP